MIRGLVLAAALAIAMPAAAQPGSAPAKPVPGKLDPYPKGLPPAPPPLPGALGDHRKVDPAALANPVPPAYESGKSELPTAAAPAPGLPARTVSPPPSFDEADPVAPDPPPPDPVDVAASDPPEDNPPASRGVAFEARPDLALIPGVWGSEERDFSLVLLPREDQLAPKDGIEIHSAGRVWRGLWVQGMIDQPLLAQVYYKPRPEEMNPEIPAWARAKLDDDLEWRIDIEARGPRHSPRIEAVWYPGEVEWTGEADGAVDIVGDGKPMRFPLRRLPLLKIEQAGPIRIEARPAYTPGDGPPAAALTSVLADQTFFVEVRAPARAAKEIGRSITVEFKGARSGATAALTLREGPERNGVVRYVHDRPITLSDCDKTSGFDRQDRYAPPVMSLEWVGNWLTGNQGTCIDFEGESNEVVELRYREAVHAFQWYASWLDAALARQRTAMSRYRVVFQALADSGGGKGGAAGPGVAERLRMIDNYDRLMANPALLDGHRLVIGNVYLDPDHGRPLLFATAADLKPSRETPGFRGTAHGEDLNAYAEAFELLPRTPGFLEFIFPRLGGENVGQRAYRAVLESGVAWTSDVERARVSSAVQAFSTRMVNEAAKQFFVGATLTTYDVVAEFSDAAGIYLMFTGYDHLGRKADDWEVVLATLQVGIQVKLQSSALRHVSFDTRLDRGVRDAMVGEIQEHLRPLKVPDEAAQVIKHVTVGPDGALRLANRAEIDKLPGTVGQRGIDRLQLELTTPTRAVRTPKVKPPDSYDVSLVPPKNVPDKVADPITLQTELLRDYGADASLRRFGTGGPFRPLRVNGNADAVTGNYVIWRETGVVLDETEGVARLRDTVYDVAGEFAPLRPHVNALGSRIPYPDAVLERRLRQAGVEIAAIDPRLNRLITPPDIKLALDAGWMAEVRLDFGDGFPRRVIVEDVLPDGAGIPRKIRLFDPKYGALADVDAERFHGLLVSSDRVGEPSMKLYRTSDPHSAAPRNKAGLAGPAGETLPQSAPPSPSTTPGANKLWSFEEANGQAYTIRLDRQLGAGATNQVYTLSDFPDQAVRITGNGAQVDQPLIDLFGRKVLAESDLNPNIVAGVERRALYEMKQPGIGGTRRYVEVIDRFDGEQASTLLAKQPGKKMTPGQAIAVEASCRELNRKGFVWTDNHSGNYAFVKMTGEDRWRVVIFDPGGILPIKGASMPERFAEARKMQRMINAPTPEARAEQARYVAGGQNAIGESIYREDVMEALGDRIDYRRLGLDDPQLPITPRSGFEQPLLEKYFGMPDHELNILLGGR